MSGPLLARPPRPLAGTVTVLVVAAGCAALAARPLFQGAGGQPLSGTVLLFTALLSVGVLAPVPAPTRAGPRMWALALGFGLAAFAAGRLLGGGHPIAAPVGTVLALNSFAAVAEEAFFRGFVFGVLSRYGVAVAVAGSAGLFAVVHVTVYGWWVLPLDAAAGAVFAWQRAATGSWAVPGLTHVWANLLAVR